MKLYRYLTNGEGVWSAGKRLLPAELVEEANQNRAWLTKPELPEGNYRFWLTEKGKEKYEQTLYITHQKYLPNITLEERNREELEEIVYEDEFQVVEQKYSGEELWNIAASLLHNPDYSRRYSQYLTDIIQDKNAKILDTACGSGFPSIELYQSGFKNITGFDGNAEALELFKGRLNQIPLMHGDWRNITEIIKDQFDVLLNVDNSLPYMDSWQRDLPMANNESDIAERVIGILKNFYQLTKPEGKIIMAIAKNNDKSSGQATQFDLGDGEYEGHKVSAVWKLTYDWEHGIKTFDNEVKIDGDTYHMIGKSYLITKEQMADLLLRAGYKKSEIIETEGLYDNLIAGYK